LNKTVGKNSSTEELANKTIETPVVAQKNAAENIEAPVIAQKNVTDKVNVTTTSAIAQPSESQAAIQTK
jgi:hypothetical protein